MGEVRNEKEKQPKRGGCLTAFLILMFVFNPVTAAVYLLSGNLIGNALGVSKAWILPVLGLISVINFLFAIGVWKWKKWGVYGLGATAVITFIVNLAAGLSILSAFAGFIGLIILILLVRPVWKELQ